MAGGGPPLSRGCASHSPCRVLVPHPPHTSGGPPGRRLAHAVSAGRATPRRVPGRLSPQPLGLRCRPWAPWRPGRAPARHASVQGHPAPHPCAVSLRRALVAPGARGLDGTKTPPAGAWRPPACPHRPVPAAPHPVAPPCHWPGWPARGRAPRSLAPRAQRPPGGPCRGPVPLPCALARTPRGASPLGGSATRSATPAPPMGAQRTLEAVGCTPWFGVTQVTRDSRDRQRRA